MALETPTPAIARGLEACLFTVSHTQMCDQMRQISGRFLIITFEGVV